MIIGLSSKSLRMFLTAAILYGAGGSQATATTIVAVRNSQEVVLAADSKDRQLDETTSVSCKIFSCGNYFIAIAGVRELRVGKLEFNAPMLVGQACQTPGNATEIMTRLTDSLIQPFTHVMSEWASINPTRYRQSVEKKEAYLNILLVGFEQETPLIVERDVIAPAVISSGVVIHSLTQNDKLPAAGVSYVFIGRHEGIDEFVRSRRAFWGLGLIEGAKFLVSYEIADIPDLVGPPIDVVSITKEGPKWVQRKAQCQGPRKKAVP
ncbi:MAG: hypothetical protein JWM21_895 [Acidobacteria bacterium]|nr:hypothetical protein [Acidobacteriota bacterium]